MKAALFMALGCVVLLIAACYALRRRVRSKKQHMPSVDTEETSLEVMQQTYKGTAVKEGEWEPTGAVKV